MQQDVLATVKPSTPRRWLGVGMLGTVGFLAIFVAITQPPEPVWFVFLLIVGCAAFWLAHRIWRATYDCIELTETELRTGAGRLIAKVEDIESVDRGVFAFKPSSGFLIKTRNSAENTWAPGLWWRLGRHVGIGGLTAAADTKFMSEVLSAQIMRRN
ncbi:hypothetical protein [Ruegeria sp.]|uniref:hypothetical protein n=1 Tax=Ruegeria sp. TaxID=1879320 RepID=UPI003B5B9786